jgi:hypothetical protein
MKDSSELDREKGRNKVVTVLNEVLCHEDMEV